MTKLTDKQSAFVEEYLIDLNATQAAIRAGYSEETAKQIGSENLTKLDIQEAVQEAQAKRSKRTEITQDWVVNGIKETIEGTRDRDDASNSLRGYELLGKHLKLFTEKHEIDTNFNVTIGDKDADCG